MGSVAWVSVLSRAPSPLAPTGQWVLPWTVGTSAGVLFFLEPQSDRGQSGNEGLGEDSWGELGLLDSELR